MLYKIEAEFMEDAQIAFRKQMGDDSAEAMQKQWEDFQLLHTRQKIASELADKIEITIKQLHRKSKIKGSFIFITKSEWQTIKSNIQKLEGTPYEHLIDEIINSILDGK